MKFNESLNIMIDDSKTLNHPSHEILIAHASHAGRPIAGFPGNSASDREHTG